MSGAHLTIDPQRAAQAERVFFAFLAYVHVMEDTITDFPRDGQVIRALCTRDQE